MEIRGEVVLISGHFNRAVGGGKLGVTSSMEKISYGGQLVRDLTEEYVILNNLDLAEGGSWTWVDLAPSRYQPGRLVPPGKALWAAVEETNAHKLLVLYGCLVFYD